MQSPLPSNRELIQCHEHYPQVTMALWLHFQPQLVVLVDDHLHVVDLCMNVVNNFY